MKNRGVPVGGEEFRHHHQRHEITGDWSKLQLSTDLRDGLPYCGHICSPVSTFGTSRVGLVRSERSVEGPDGSSTRLEAGLAIGYALTVFVNKNVVVLGASRTMRTWYVLVHLLLDGLDVEAFWPVAG